MGVGPCLVELSNLAVDQGSFVVHRDAVSVWAWGRSGDDLVLEFGHSPIPRVTVWVMMRLFLVLRQENSAAFCSFRRFLPLLVAFYAEILLVGRQDFAHCCSFSGLATERTSLVAFSMISRSTSSRRV